MDALLKPVILRMIFYIMSPLLAMIPVSWAGLVAVQITENWHLLADVNIGGLVSIGITAAIGSGAVFAKWGFKK
jgi:hypothetical protein